MKEIEIRPATLADADQIWDIFHSHVKEGDSYAFAPDSPRAVCDAFWFGPQATPFVATLANGRVLGMYKLVPNQPDRGAHVANGSYMVSPAAQGVGVGRALGEHSIEEARRQGYLALQFNFVVSTNQTAVALWKKLGFAIVGTLPGAYRHRYLGYVDAYVMFRALSDSANWPDPEI